MGYERCLSVVEEVELATLACLKVLYARNRIFNVLHISDHLNTAVSEEPETLINDGPNLFS